VGSRQPESSSRVAALLTESPVMALHPAAPLPRAGAGNVVAGARPSQPAKMSPPASHPAAPLPRAGADDVVAGARPSQPAKMSPPAAGTLLAGGSAATVDSNGSGADAEVPAARGEHAQAPPSPSPTSPPQTCAGARAAMPPSEPDAHSPSPCARARACARLGRRPSRLARRAPPMAPPAGPALAQPRDRTAGSKACR
jgi:hypothetical protein